MGDNSAGEHQLPLELRQPDHDGPAVRLLAARRCRRTSATRRTARPRSSRPSTASTRFRTPDRQGDDLEEVRGRLGRPEHGRLRRPQRRRHAADHRPDLPLRRGQRAAGRLPALLRRLVADQQPRLQRRLLEGSPAPQGQQPDAARQRLAPVQLGRHDRRGAVRPGHRLAVRPRRPALPGALLGRLLPLEHERRRPDADREDLLQRPGRVPDRHGRAERHPRGHRPGLPGRGRTRTSTRPR